jgi:hypothetical protein
MNRLLDTGTIPKAAFASRVPLQVLDEALGHRAMELSVQRSGWGEACEDHL